MCPNALGGLVSAWHVRMTIIMGGPVVNAVHANIRAMHEIALLMPK